MLNDADVLFLLGADELNMAERTKGFTIYIGSHGDVGAHHADVILPAQPTPKNLASMSNTEGRVQVGARAAFAPGEAKEDWAILRALSDVLGHKLPFDSLPQLRAALLRRIRTLPPATRYSQPMPVMLPSWPRWAARPAPAGFESPVKDFYLTNPIARASAVMAECSSWQRVLARSQPSKDQDTMTLDAFVANYVWPGLIMVGQSVLLLVVLLIFIAYILYADRKIWAAVQMRRGPNVVGPWGLFQSLRICSNSCSRSRSSRPAPTRAFSCWRRWFP